MEIGIRPSGAVALRKESVDRNKSLVCCRDCQFDVALRKESVDRNLLMWYQSNTTIKSLSARRAWIEIGGMRTAHCDWIVALRKESVDRNTAFPEILV